jgi:hypothetical protein
VTGAVGEEREARQRAFFNRLGLAATQDPDRFQINFALTHGGA